MHIHSNHLLREVVAPLTFSFLLVTFYCLSSTQCSRVQIWRMCFFRKENYTEASWRLVQQSRRITPECQQTRLQCKCRQLWEQFSADLTTEIPNDKGFSQRHNTLHSKQYTLASNKSNMNLIDGLTEIGKQLDQYGKIPSHCKQILQL